MKPPEPLFALTLNIFLKYIFKKFISDCHIDTADCHIFIHFIHFFLFISKKKGMTKYVGRQYNINCRELVSKRENKRGVIKTLIVSCRSGSGT
jgi:hypothetical protein